MRRGVRGVTDPTAYEGLTECVRRHGAALPTTATIVGLLEVPVEVSCGDGTTQDLWLLVAWDPDATVEAGGGDAVDGLVRVAMRAGRAAERLAREGGCR